MHFYRWNFPLELAPEEPCLPPERLKPPQPLRKASQTARGFNHGASLRRVALSVPDADFVYLLQRIHSPGGELDAVSHR